MFTHHNQNSNPSKPLPETSRVTLNLRNFSFIGIVVLLFSLGTVVNAATAGDLDVSFGTAGKTSTPFPDFGLAVATAIQPDGKIVVVGGKFDIARYTVDGALDPTFGIGGKVSYSLGFSAQDALSVAVQPNGKIVIAGDANFDLPDGGLVVMRLNPNGSLDPTFGGDGIASVKIGDNPSGSGIGVAVQSDGKVVAAGTRYITNSNSQFFAARFSADGTLDNGFGTGGVAFASDGLADRANALILQPDGKVLVGGATTIDQHDTDFMMGRFNPNGTLDASFGVAGVAVSRIGTAYDNLTALALQPDGKIVAAGGVDSDSHDLAIIRYTATGQLDVGHFGSGGKLIVDFGGQFDEATGVAVDSHGFIVATGTTQSPQTGFHMVMVRCEDDGDLDATFGVNGKVQLSFGGNYEFANGIVLQPVNRLGDLSDYKIILIGNLGVGPGSFTVARFHSLSGPIWRAVVNDFDGDRGSEMVAFRPSTGDWLIGKLSQPGFPGGLVATIRWGLSGDRLVPGDYDGDGKYDAAVYRAGSWYILNSGGTSYRSVSFGLSDDVPVPADYDGDGRTDLAVFRPSNGAWYILRSSDGNLSSTFWGANGDKPVVGNYDGDDRADLAVYRGGIWYILQSSNGQLRVVYFGLPSDQPVPYDFDFDNHTDFAVYRGGDWYISYSNNFPNVQMVKWGLPGDTPVPGRYASDYSIANFRNGTFYLNGTFISWYTGAPTDIAVPTFFAP
jgi:uncharacterized delta-60 repeat protein